MKVTDQRITDEAELVYQAIERFIADHGYPPTVREIEARTGIPRVHVHDRLVHLRGLGRLTWTPRRARTLRIVR